jgi:hypothetical protein
VPGEWCASHARPVGAVLAVIVVLVAASPAMLNPYRGAPWLPDASYALEASSVDNGPLVMRFETQGWPLVAGIVELERRHGRDICVENAAFALVFTQALICTPAQRAAGRVIWVDPSRNEGSPLFALPGVFIGEM